jgi:hypothetical protein
VIYFDWYWKTGHSLQSNELLYTPRSKMWMEWKTLAAKSLTINLESSLRQYTPSNLWTNVERMQHSFKCPAKMLRIALRSALVPERNGSIPFPFHYHLSLMCASVILHTVLHRISQLEPSWSVSVIIPRKNHWYNKSFIHRGYTSTHIARELGDRPLNPAHGHPRPTEVEILLVRLSFDLVWAPFINDLISLTLHIPS